MSDSINNFNQKLILCVNSLYNQPLFLAVPIDAFSNFDSGQNPEIKFDFILSLDKVLRTLTRYIPGNAYALLETHLGVKQSNGEADFFHMRHWDDSDPIAGFIVSFRSDHQSEQMAGKVMLATRRHELLSNVFLPPQTEHNLPMTILVDEQGNLALPFDEPMDINHIAFPLGIVGIHAAQFCNDTQCTNAYERLEAFGYTVEIIA